MYRVNPEQSYAQLITVLSLPARQLLTPRVPFKNSIQRFATPSGYAWINPVESRVARPNASPVWASAALSLDEPWPATDRPKPLLSARRAVCDTETGETPGPRPSPSPTPCPSPTPSRSFSSVPSPSGSFSLSPPNQERCPFRCCLSPAPSS